MFYYKKIFKESLKFNKAQDIIDWVNTLNITKRKPQSLPQVEHQAILNLYSIVNNPDYKFNTNFRDALLLGSVQHLRLNKEDYESAYNSKNQPKIIKGKYAEYIHDDTGSYQRFLDNVFIIDNLLGNLKGYHKKALNNLKIKFVSSQDIKTTAKYKSGTKTLLINPLSKKIGNTKEDYGSLPYIIVHELGHKFLEENRQSWNINDPLLQTTPYSKKDTMTEEEVFAELFALSNWKSKYPQYKKQIDKFEELINV